MLFRIQDVNHNQRRHAEHIESRIHGLAKGIIFEVGTIPQAGNRGRFIMKNKRLVYRVIGIRGQVDRRRSYYAL